MRGSAFGRVLLLWAAAAAAPATARAPAVSFTHFLTGVRPNGVAQAPGETVMVDLAGGQPVTLRWAFRCAAETTCAQTTSRVQLFEAARPTTAARVYDSGVVTGPDPFHTLPLGRGGAALTLDEATKYVWTVTLSVAHGARNTTSTVVSPGQSLFTSLQTWTAAPVWAAAAATADPDPKYAFLRRSLGPLPAAPLSAVVFITANPPPTAKHGDETPSKILGAYKLWVNGEMVTMGPGRPRCGPKPCVYGFQPEQVVDGIDVTRWAVDGDGALDIFISGYGNAAPWISADVRVHFAADAGIDPLVARTGVDAGWEALDATPVYRPTGQSGCGWYFYPSENIDASAPETGGTPLAPTCSSPSSAAREEEEDDDDDDENDQNMLVAPWAAPVVLQNFTWLPITPKPVAPMAVLMADAGPHNINTSGASRAGAARAAVVTKLGPGHFFFDLGREIQGGVVLTATLPQPVATTVVRLRVQEELASPPNSTAPPALLWPPRTGTHPEFNWTLAATTAPQTLQHHEYLEFRYGELLFDAAAPATLAVSDLDVSAWVVHLPSDTRAASSAALNTSSAALDAVWGLCRDTLVVAPLDLYSDSNARQRSADCVADDVTSIKGQLAISNELALPRFATEQMMAIGVATRIDWAVLPIVAVYEWTMHTGDLSLAESTFDRLLSAHARLDAMSTDRRLGGLVDSTSAENQALVDWPPGMEDGYVRNNASSISSAWVLHGAVHLAKLARLLPGRQAEAARLENVSSTLRSEMRKQQYDARRGAFCDGVCADTPHLSFHATMYALAFGALDDAEDPEAFAAAWAYLRGRISPPFAAAGRWPPPGPSSGKGLPCGTYPAQFALEALYRNSSDRGLSALRVLESNATNSWVHMLRQGATMTLEMWDPEEKPNLTWSHPWSSSPAFLVAWFLMGIRPLTPGFGSVAVRPQPGDLARGAFVLPTIRGPVAVDFSQTAGGATFSLSVTLPGSVVASVAVPLPARGAVAGELCLRVDGAAAAAAVVPSATADGQQQHFAAADEAVGPGGHHTFVLAPCHQVDNHH